jgi:hypothetical protein
VARGLDGVVRVVPPGRTSDGRVCPACGAISISRILYGYPLFSQEIRAEIDAGRAELGGCFVGPDQADRRCRACGARFRADGRRPRTAGPDRGGA